MEKYILRICDQLLQLIEKYWVAEAESSQTKSPKMLIRYEWFRRNFSFICVFGLIVVQAAFVTNRFNRCHLSRTLQKLIFSSNRFNWDILKLRNSFHTSATYLIHAKSFIKNASLMHDFILINYFYLYYNTGLSSHFYQRWK